MLFLRQVLDQRIGVYRGTSSTGVHVDGTQPSVLVQYRPCFMGQVASWPVPSVQQHSVSYAVASIPCHTVAVAIARSPLPAHTVPAA